MMNSEDKEKTRPCPGCGDPAGDCPNQSCVRDDWPHPALCDYKGNPIDE